MARGGDGGRTRHRTLQRAQRGPLKTEPMTIRAEGEGFFTGKQHAERHADTNEPSGPIQGTACHPIWLKREAHRGC